MILIMSSTGIAQTVPLRQTKWPPQLKVIMVEYKIVLEQI